MGTRARQGAAMPVPFRVERFATVAAPAHEALRVLVDPATTPAIEGPEAFTVLLPGRPVGAVGERRCVVVPVPVGSALVGHVQEVVELVPGRRWASVDLAGSERLRRSCTAEPLLPDTSLLRLTVEGTGPADVARHAEEALGPELDHALAVVAHLVAGWPPPQRPEPSAALRRIRATEERRWWDLARAPRQTVRLHDVARTDASPVRTWLAVADGSHEHWYAADPDALSFTVPGTPAGEPGELRVMVHHGSTGGLDGHVSEVLAVEPGRALVVRERGLFPTVRTVWLEPDGAGTRVTREVVVDSPDPDVSRQLVAAELRAWREALLRHLGG